MDTVSPIPLTRKKRWRGVDVTLPEGSHFCALPSQRSVEASTVWLCQSNLQCASVSIRLSLDDSLWCFSRHAIHETRCSRQWFTFHFPVGFQLLEEGGMPCLPPGPSVSVYLQYCRSARAKKKDFQKWSNIFHALAAKHSNQAHITKLN